jgi:hypothetical protein
MTYSSLNAVGAPFRRQKGIRQEGVSDYAGRFIVETTGVSTYEKGLAAASCGRVVQK